MWAQGKNNSKGHGQLWSVLGGMEFLLKHLEDLKLQYSTEDTNAAQELAIDFESDQDSQPPRLRRAARRLRRRQRR